MKIEQFEDIRAWQQARQLSNLVYDLTEKGSFAKDFCLRDQIQGAAGSIMHNIAEGFDDGSDAEFIHFLKYARRSASEVQSEIYPALDRKYVSQADFQWQNDHVTTRLFDYETTSYSTTEQESIWTLTNATRKSTSMAAAMNY